MVVNSVRVIPQVDKGVVPLAGTCGETTTQGQTQLFCFTHTKYTARFFDTFLLKSPP